MMNTIRKDRFPLERGRRAADWVVDLLSPHCDRIEIAGSIRRERPDVGDVEVVAIPRTIQGGLFEDMTERDPAFCSIVAQWDKVRGEVAEGKYTQRILPGGILLDLFLATPENWGTIFTIRTGSADWVRRNVAGRWSRQGWSSEGGILEHWDGRRQELHEEQDVFDFLGLAWVDPCDREVEPCR